MFLTCLPCLANMLQVDLGKMFFNELHVCQKLWFWLSQD